MCNCTSGNLEIPGSPVSLTPRNDNDYQIVGFHGAGIT
ncbi:MAG: hypothetical protein QOI87_3134, partial [Bradyrhizobium sp.]|nr:hypothetical protein [Bradyrhizobium sp.]